MGTSGSFKTGENKDKERCKAQAQSFTTSVYLTSVLWDGKRQIAFEMYRR